MSKLNCCRHHTIYVCGHRLTTVGKKVLSIFFKDSRSNPGGLIMAPNCISKPAKMFYFIYLLKLYSTSAEGL